MTTKKSLKPLNELANNCREGDLILLRNPRIERGLPVYLVSIGIKQIEFSQDPIFNKTIVYNRITKSIQTYPLSQRDYTHYEVLRRARKR